MTKDQLWHRLAGAPDFVSVNVICYSHADLVPASDQMKLFARQMFEFLCTCDGLLAITMNGLDDSPEETDEGCHFLKISHSYHLPHQYLSHQHRWDIDSAECVVGPPT
ncbi:hypothetical protein ABBQ38_007754 [Trebouxia sp. C0009 RCD-2024]